MPGRLMMDQQGVTASQDMKKDRSQAQEGHMAQKRDFAQMQSSSQANGSTSHATNGPLPNGLPVQAPPTTNGQDNSAHAATSLPTPPPLDGSWRETDSNKSLGLLIERLAQQCFGDLNDTLTKMSEIPAPSAAQPNGISPHPDDKSDGSLSRKRTLMEFAQNQRDRFIKTLVLSDWARNGEDMARLVDLKVWQTRQADAQRYAVDFPYKIKQDVRNVKMPNPNIEGALELLSTGKTPQVPDLGYLPPKRLSAKQLLKTLRNMNVALITRLNLHEDLPAHFNDFSVANGRATFRVPGEFEVDLSVADEDPATLFYFIDIRFLFTPTPSLADDGLRMHLEERCNAALTSDGLRGCYEFLHRYVLAHKVNALRAQAVKLLRDQWFDTLRPEMHRQVLTLQYWKGQRAPKSWIEIGVSSGKQKGSAARKQTTPRNSFRWFRHGVEVEDHGIKIDWHNLDLATILGCVTAKHADWALRAIKETFETFAGPSSKVDVQLESSDTSPEGCSLAFSLSGLQKAITTRFEPITGQISISPPNRNAQQAEKSINNNADVNRARSLAEVVARSIQDRVMHTASRVGWTPVDLSKVFIPNDVKKLLGVNSIRSTLYKCSNGWGNSWALFISFTLSGAKWFIVRIDDNMDQGRPPRIMSSARKVDLEDSLVEITQASLLHVQNVAEAEVSFAVLVKELDDSRRDYRIESISRLTGRDTEAGDGRAIYFSSTPRKQSGTKAPLKDSWIRLKPWKQTITEQGIAEIQHDLRLSVDPSRFQQLIEYLTSSSRPSDIVMNKSGALGMRLTAPFGQPFMERIKNLLARCHRLNHYLKLLKLFGYRCTEISLERFAFVYSAAPEAAAEITFGAQGHSQLKLTPRDNNPHQRLRVVLEKAYNQAGDDGLGQLIFNLRGTSPLLKVLDKLESANSSEQSVVVHIRDVHNYTLIYKAPLPACKFLISMQRVPEPQTERREYQFRCKADTTAAGPALLQALRGFSKKNGVGWYGDQAGGFGSGAQGLSDAFSELDKFVRSYDGATDVPIKKQEKQDTPAANVKPKPSPAQLQAAQRNNQQRPPAQPRQHSRNSVKQEVIELD